MKGPSLFALCSAIVLSFGVLAGAFALMSYAGAQTMGRPESAASNTPFVDQAYAERVARYIKPFVTLAPPIPQGVAAEAEIQMDPSGKIVGYRISRSSGAPTVDEALLRAIATAAVLPRNADGKVPPVVYVNFRPN